MKAVLKSNDEGKFVVEMDADLAHLLFEGVCVSQIIDNYELKLIVRDRVLRSKETFELFKTMRNLMSFLNLLSVT